MTKLIASGCDVNRQDYQRKTALNYACATPNVNKEVIRALLEHGASPCDLDSAGLNPLMYTLMSPSFSCDIVSMLMSRGARVDLVTGQGNNPLHFVILSNNLE